MRPSLSGLRRGWFHCDTHHSYTVVKLAHRLQPLLGRNARGLRRDALGEHTLLLCRTLSCARVTCGTRALRSNVAIWR